MRTALQGKYRIGSKQLVKQDPWVAACAVSSVEEQVQNSLLQVRRLVLGVVPSGSEDGNTTDVPELTLKGHDSVAVGLVESWAVVPGTAERTYRVCVDRIIVVGSGANRMHTHGLAREGVEFSECRAADGEVINCRARITSSETGCSSGKCERKLHQ